MRMIFAVGIAVLVCGFVGCQSSLPSRPESAVPLVVRFYLEAMPGETAFNIQLPQSEVHFAVAPKPVFSEFDVINAEVARVELGLCVLMQLTPAASRDLYRLSVLAQGRRLVVSLDGVCLGVHRIEHVMADGVIPVFLEVPDDQLPGIVRQIKLASATMVRAAEQAAKK